MGLLAKFFFLSLLILETIFLLDQSYFDEITVEGKIQYIVYKKDSENECKIFVSDKPDEVGIHLFNIKLKRRERTFLISGNRAICEEVRNSEEVMSLRLFMTRLYKHPSAVLVIRLMEDTYHQTPYLVKYQFYLLHLSFITILGVSIFDFKSLHFPIHKWLGYILGMYLTIVYYFLITNMIAYEYFGNHLVYKIVE